MHTTLKIVIPSVALVIALSLIAAYAGSKKSRGSDSEIRSTCLDGVKYWLKEGNRSDAMSVAYNRDGSVRVCE